MDGLTSSAGRGTGAVSTDESCTAWSEDRCQEISRVSFQKAYSWFDMTKTFKPMIVFQVINFYFIFQECLFLVNRLEMKNKLVLHHT